MLYLRSQSVLLDGVKARTRDTSSVSWSDGEMMMGINDALLGWANRISCPMVYAPGTAWPENTYYVTLPTYMEPRNIELQMRPSDDDPWVSMSLSRITVQATGTHAIQIPWKNEAQWQLIFYVENGQLPVTAPTLDADITTASTTLSVSPAVDVAPAGWMLIDSEYISYVGVESSASSTVFTGLGRAANFSTLGTHAAGATVKFCAAANDLGAFSQLMDGALARLYELALADSSTTEQPMLERMVSFYSGRSESFWRRHVPSRSPRWMAYTTTVPDDSGFGVVVETTG